MLKGGNMGGKSIFPFLAVFLFGGCSQENGIVSDKHAPPSLVEEYSLTALPPVEYPLDDAPTPEKVSLGRFLFFDPILSGHGDVACATCHHPDYAYADGRTLPVGSGGKGLGPDRYHPFGVRGERNAPSILNAAYIPDSVFYADGQPLTLHDQVFAAMENATWMRGVAYLSAVAVDSVLARLRANTEYVARFEQAFPELPGIEFPESLIVRRTLARALVAFERTLTSGDSPYDRFACGDPSALGSDEQAGLVLFFERAGCVRCHPPPTFTDFDFHVLGPSRSDPDLHDPGHFGLTGNADDLYAFRTPSLRNVAETGPYTHTGGYVTLAEVVGFHLRGGGDDPLVDSSSIDPFLLPVELSQTELRQLLAFLYTLTDPNYPKGVPEAVPSGLPVAGQ